MPDVFEESNNQYKDLYSQYEEAQNSPYASFVPSPVRTAHDLLLGAIDDSYGQKLQEYISKVKSLELQDLQYKRQYDTLFAALKEHGINPYYMFGGSGGSMSGNSSFRPEDTSPQGVENTGANVIMSLLAGSIGGLISALGKSRKSDRESTKNVTNYFFGKK